MSGCGDAAQNQLYCNYCIVDCGAPSMATCPCSCAVATEFFNKLYVNENDKNPRTVGRAHRMHVLGRDGW